MVAKTHALLGHQKRVHIQGIAWAQVLGQVHSEVAYAALNRWSAKINSMEQQHITNPPA